MICLPNFEEATKLRNSNTSFEFISVQLSQRVIYLGVRNFQNSPDQNQNNTAMQTLQCIRAEESLLCVVDCS